MNKKILLLTFSILLVIFVSAYLIFKPKVPRNVHTQLLTISDIQYLTADSTRGALTIDIMAEFPVFYANEKVLKLIRSQVISNLAGDNFLTFEDDSVLRYFVDELKSEYIRNNEMVVEKLEKTGYLLLNNSFVMEGFSLLNDEQIFSYGITRDVDFGGNHPTRTRFFYNYNLKNGALITENDIFNEGYEEQLTALLRDEIKRISNDDEEMPVMNSYDDTVYNISAIRPNGNFYINDQAICYVFNPFEIAPPTYALETEVVLPYRLLKTLIKDNSPIQYLVQQHEATLSANK